MIFPASQAPVMNDAVGVYKFVETSDQWNLMCKELPCFAEMYWPGYATKCIDVKINGADAVVQLWKGFCPQLLGANNAFPGGVGAEVGIYRRLPPEKYEKTEKQVLKPGVLKAVVMAKGPVAKVIAATAKTGPVLARHAHDLDKTLAAFRHPLTPPKGAGDVWYPAPDLGTKLTWRLVHPPWSANPKKVDGGLLETFFDTPDGFRNRTGYWCNRWMNLRSYEIYKATHKVPPKTTDFILEYRINGVLQPRW